MKSNNTSLLEASSIAAGKGTTELWTELAPHGDFDEKGNAILLIAVNTLRGMKPMDFFPKCGRTVGFTASQRIVNPSGILMTESAPGSIG